MAFFRQGWRHGLRIATMAGALTLGPAVAQTAPTPPARPHGLAPEAPLKDAPALVEKARAKTGEDRKPDAGAATLDAPPQPPPRPDGLDKAETGRRAEPHKPERGKGEPARPETSKSETTKSEATKSESTKPDAAKPDAAKSDPVKSAAATPTLPPVTVTAAPPAAPDACMVELAALGVDAPKAEAPAGENGCGIETPVRLKSVPTRDGRVVLHGEPLISCATARAAALYLLQTAGPLAKGGVGQALTGVTTAGYECRPRNRQPGGKLSAHGKGLALDVMSFQFADGSSMSVAAPGDKATYLNGARKAACGYFTTVLGPGADAAHRDHLHLDIEPHGSSGYGRICQ